MSKKRILTTAVVVLALAGLIYLQVRTWRKFEWHKFAAATEGANFFLIGVGVALVFLAYYLRAVRWKILLRPVRQTASRRLIAPTVIGFTATALLGRPGEFIRPYMIARREGLTMSSQMAVWTVERIFDVGAFGLIMAVNILLNENSLRQLPFFMKFKIAAFIILGGVSVAALVAFLAQKSPGHAARLAERMLGPISKRFAQAVGHRVQAFGEGLRTVHDFGSFLQLTGVSLLIWIVVGFAYVAVTRAYVDPTLSGMTLPRTLFLTAGSVAGGLLQLPMVGGGSQLATIAILKNIFGVTEEISTSCGMMLWLVTFMSIIPVGLIAAHREHVSFTKLEEESIVEEEKAIEEIG